MTDQELHRLSALAAGHELRWSHEWPGGGCLMRRVVPDPEHPGSKWVPWRPLIANRMAQSNHWAICFSVAREIGGPGNARLLFLPVAYSLKITPLHMV